MKSVEEVTPFSPYWHFTAAVLVVLFVSALVASCLTRVDVVAQSSGRIVPSSAIRPVDSQVAGKIVEVFASPGEFLTKGDPIMRVDATEFESEIKNLESRMGKSRQAEYRAHIALNVLAKIDPAASEFVQTATKQYLMTSGAGDASPGMQALLQAELSSLSAAIAENDATLEKLQADLVSSSARVKRSATVLAIEDTAFRATDNLLKLGTISQIDYLKRSQPFELAKAEVEISRQEYLSRKAEIAALGQRRRALIASSVERYQTLIETESVTRIEIEAKLTVARRNSEASTIRAPANGHIEEFLPRTVGARLNQGQTVGKIIPEDGTIELEAKLPSNEASFVREGQPARVKLDAYPAERFGSISARIRTISTDTVPGSDGKWNFVLKVETEKSYLATPSGNVPLSAGMTARVDVITGNRRLLSYLFEPVVRALTEGLNER
jgi:hemolysin D